MATFTSNSAAETETIGRSIALALKPGDILALQGELGAGKTQLARGVVAGLGSETQVTSPTFTIVHEYVGGRLPVYHLDLFRLENPQAVEQLGLDEYFFGDGVSIIEWADRFRGMVPKHARWIEIETQGDTHRTITMR